jgi:hypothetical protein
MLTSDCSTWWSDFALANIPFRTSHPMLMMQIRFPFCCFPSWKIMFSFPAWEKNKSESERTCFLFMESHRTRQSSSLSVRRGNIASRARGLHGLGMALYNTVGIGLVCIFVCVCMDWVMHIGMPHQTVIPITHLTGTVRHSDASRHKNTRLLTHSDSELRE